MVGQSCDLFVKGKLVFDYSLLILLLFHYYHHDSVVLAVMSDPQRERCACSDVRSATYLAI